MRRISLLLLFFHSTFIYAQNRSYDKVQLKADLRFLQSKLEKTHPALYRYTPQRSFTIYFDSLANSITRSMNETEFLGLISLLNAKIRDGHTMFLPSVETTNYNNKEGKFLPFMLNYVNGRLYIIENNSSDSSIEKGEEIISINGASTNSVIRKLLARQIRDGYNETYPVWILNHYFPSYYSFTFGQPAQFDLELKNNNGRQYRKHVTALTKDSINFFSQSRYPTSSRRGITLEETEDKKTAVLAIKSFDPDIILSVFRQDYKHSIDSIFTALKNNGITNLVLDLRDNQGGEFEPGRYLLSYLILKPTQYLLSGNEAKLIQPDTNAFTGKLYVLVNGGSFSNTAIISATLERDQRAIIIGEETGGNKYILSGSATEITLPKTWIRAYISTETFRILDGAGNGRGVMPAYPVIPDIKDILSGKDRAKEIALKLISQQ